MLKLARNGLADVKVFVHDCGKLIKWDHIKVSIEYKKKISSLETSLEKSYQNVT